MNRLPASGKYLQEVFDDLPQVVFELDKTGKITLLNRNGFQLFGFTEKELEKKNAFFRIFNQKDRRLAIKEITSARQSTRVQHTVFRKDGTSFPAGIYLNPITIDGEYRGVRSILLDISERVAVEESLRESEEKFRRLFEGSRDSMMIGDGITFSDCNKATLAMFGCKNRSEFIGKTALDFSPSRQADGHESKVLGMTYLKEAKKKWSRSV